MKSDELSMIACNKHEGIVIIKNPHITLTIITHITSFSCVFYTTVPLYDILLVIDRF